MSKWNSESERHQSRRGRGNRNYGKNFVADPVFMAGVPGVSPVCDKGKVARIQAKVQELCGWNSKRFPGSQPVSMDKKNIHQLHYKPYRVSWKADGTRYMMLIQADKEIFFIDRNNHVFQVNGFRFPYSRDPSQVLRDTLLDGEMVIDKVDGVDYPRYLAYDAIMFDGKKVSQLPFYPDRYKIVKEEVMAPRRRAFDEGRLHREKEPFSIRLKEFWDLSATEGLLSDKFIKQLGHEHDGLIFQPADDPYVAGTAPDVLKWKPLSMNSVDFRLKLVGSSSKEIGELYVKGLEKPFGNIKVSSSIEHLNNKIIECKFESGQWVFMRERVDKSFPNFYKTAEAICKTIEEPISANYLLDYLDRYTFREEEALRNPPTKRMRYE